MRTLASTFSTSEQAQAAARRLEAVGIGRERIVLKEVAPAEANSRGLPAGAVFLSVKVTTEQVEPASDILKSSAIPGDATPPVPSPIPAAPIAQPIDEPPPLPPSFAEPRPVIARHDPEPRPISARGDADMLERDRPSSAAAGDSSRTLRYALFFALAVLAAFLLGAVLGLII